LPDHLTFNFNQLPPFIKWQLTLPAGQKLIRTYSLICPRCNKEMQTVKVDCIPFGLQTPFAMNLSYCPCSETDFILPMELTDALRSFL